MLSILVSIVERSTLKPCLAAPGVLQPLGQLPKMARHSTRTYHQERPQPFPDLGADGGAVHIGDVDAIWIGHESP
jgi:hypothetical protein